MHRIIALATCLALVQFSGIASPAPKKTEVPKGSPFTEIKQDLYSFSYRRSGDRLECVIRAPTTGWVAIGFDPVYRMQGANIIIGYVKDNKGVISDDFGVSSIIHRPDDAIGGKNDVVLIDASEKANFTTLHFTIPLNSNDPKDVKLQKGKHKAIFAYGRNDADNFNSIHYGLGVFEFTLN